MNLKIIIGKPTVIIAHTFKGKGVFIYGMDQCLPRQSPTEEEMIKALEELK